MALSREGIKLTLKGNREFQRKLKAGIIKLSDGRKLHARIGTNLLKVIDKGFRTEGVAVTGRRWRNLKPATIRQRRRGPGTGNAKILQDTGRLKGSFTMEFKEDEVRVGTAVVYSEVHEKGSRRKRGRGGGIPKRPMLPVRGVAQPIVNRTYDRFVEEALRRSGLR
jgi:phage gpG-like protein